MQTISLKLSDNIVIRIDEYMEKHNYATRSEFIRDAIRDKLESLENQNFESEVRDYLNKSAKNEGFNKNSPYLNTKQSEELEKAKKDIFLELEHKFQQLREHLD